MGEEIIEMPSARDLKKREDNYDLKSIIAPIEPDFRRFKNDFKTVINSDIKLLNIILKYISNQNGKKIRPILLLLSSGLCGKIGDNNIKSASLIHDDIVDNSDKRRGAPTVNNLWKNQLSVLVGDYLFSKVFESALEMDNMEILKILSIITKRMSSGEI